MRHVQLAAAIIGGVLIAGTAPAQAASTATKAARHYDCSKPGNANKAVCKSAATPAAPGATPAPAASPAAVTRTTTTTHTVRTASAQTTSAAGPNGATALCNDGSYSHSAHHQGSCAGHKGVKQFY